MSLTLKKGGRRNANTYTLSSKKKRGKPDKPECLTDDDCFKLKGIGYKCVEGVCQKIHSYIEFTNINLGTRYPIYTFVLAAKLRQYLIDEIDKWEKHAKIENSISSFERRGLRGYDAYMEHENKRLVNMIDNEIKDHIVKGANINVLQDYEPKTIFMLFLDLLNILKDMDIDYTKFRKTFLLFVIKSDNQINMTDIKDNTVLDYTIKYDMDEFSHILIKNDKLIENRTNKYSGDTYLHTLIKNEKWQLIKFLISKKKIDKKIKNNSGKLALDILVDKKNELEEEKNNIEDELENAQQNLNEAQISQDWLEANISDTQEEINNIQVIIDKLYKID